LPETNVTTILWIDTHILGAGIALPLE